MRILGFIVVRFMKFQLLKISGLMKKLMFFCFIILICSCKKEIIEIEVDAFKNLQQEVKMLDNGTYRISFVLQDFDYDDYGLKLTSDKNNFFKGINLVNYSIYPLENKRFGSFVNSLEKKKTYYYQIFVKGNSSSKEVNSEVYSFTTEP